VLKLASRYAAISIGSLDQTIGGRYADVLDEIMAPCLPDDVPIRSGLEMRREQEREEADDSGERVFPGHASRCKAAHAFRTSLELVSRPRLPHSLLRPLPRVHVDLLQALHRLAPESFETVGEALHQIAIADEQRREAHARHERVIERQNDDIVVHDMERMSELARVSHSGKVPDFGAMSPQELEELGCARRRGATDKQL